MRPGSRTFAPSMNRPSPARQLFLGSDRPWTETQLRALSHTFCETLDPPYDEPQWWIPSDVVMAVVVGNEAYGVDVRIARVFSGTLELDSEIRVWGDCGALCRRFVSGMNEGDTVVWALQPTDLSGNFICGTELESKGEYQLSVCGVYALAYGNGQVTGPITTESGTEMMTLDQLESLVTGCLSTGIKEANEKDPMIVLQGPNGTAIAMATLERVKLRVSDAAGRTCIDRDWDGSILSLDVLQTGAYFVSVQNNLGTLRRKVVVE